MKNEAEPRLLNFDYCHRLGCATSDRTLQLIFYFAEWNSIKYISENSTPKLWSMFSYIGASKTSSTLLQGTRRDSTLLPRRVTANEGMHSSGLP